MAGDARRPAGQRRHTGRAQPVKRDRQQPGLSGPLLVRVSQGVRVILGGGPGGVGFGADPAKLRELARTALAEAAAGRIRPVIGQETELARAAEAHAAIEARATIGKTLLAVSS